LSSHRRNGQDCDAHVKFHSESRGWSCTVLMRIFIVLLYYEKFLTSIRVVNHTTSFSVSSLYDSSAVVSYGVLPSFIIIFTSVVGFFRTFWIHLRLWPAPNHCTHFPPLILVPLKRSDAVAREAFPHAWLYSPDSLHCERFSYCSVSFESPSAQGNSQAWLLLTLDPNLLLMCFRSIILAMINPLTEKIFILTPSRLANTMREISKVGRRLHLPPRFHRTLYPFPSPNTRIRGTSVSIEVY